MGLILGIDTGGTYTDSVLIAERQVVRKAKSATTRDNLLRGILSSVKKLRWERMEEISIVCLSTTLATNAVVEGRGGRTGLLYMGRALPAERIPADIICPLSGKLDIKGRECERIQPEEVEQAMERLRGNVDAIAISGFASVRNPAHEMQVKRLVQEQMDVPIVCAHELSTSLGFADRTTTAVLNAALIPNITRLIEAVRAAMGELGIHAPCMVVRGDGSLIRDTVALDRPIETVLSGPAASVAGGIFLTGETDALVIDMGGTTTDIANVTDGAVRIQKRGATVGGWRTQLRAAEISTHGIGGDSWIQFDRHGGLQVGPERVVPLCVAGMRNPGLHEEWKRYRPKREHEIFNGQVVDAYELLQPPEQPNYDENKLMELLADGPHSRFYLSERMGCDYDKMDFSEYVRRGMLQRCSLTPTDVLIASGSLRISDETAEAAAAMMAYRAAQDTPAFLRRCRRAVRDKLRIACLQSAADFEGSEFNFYDPAMEFILQQEHDFLQAKLTLSKKIIAIGAPVAAWFPEVCRLLGTELLIPEHAEVANAVGAAVGQVVIHTEALIRPDQYHKGYMAHAAWGNRWFEQRERAEQWAAQEAERRAREQAREAGSGVCTVRCVVKPTYSENTNVFIQSEVTVTAIGSPRWTE